MAATDTQAQEANHGIAMHGTLKYPASFPHLDYANPDAPQGGKLHQAVVGQFDTLNSLNIKGNPAAGLHFMNDTLAVRVWDEPFTLYGLIAKEIIVPDDRSSITFILNTQARFHDGEPILAEDIKFSFETLKEHGKPNTRSVYKLVENVVSENAHHIRFELGDGYDRETVMILAMMTVIPKHYWEGKSFDETTLEIPVGSGPYMIESFEAGRQITYKRTPDYWANSNPVRVGHNNFDQLVYDYYRDETVALEAFQAGEYDMRREYNLTRWTQAYDTSRGFVKEEIAHSRPEPLRGFIMNTRRSLLSAPAVRKAMITAFDFEGVNARLFSNKATQVSGLFYNSALASDTKLPGHDLSRRERLKAADSLLTDAGYIVKDGIRTTPDGQPFELTVILAGADEEKIALDFARNLERLGIKLTARTLDTAQFMGALNDYDYDLISWRWINSLSPGSEQLIYWGCDAAETKGSRNYAGLCDQDIDDLAKQIALSTNYQELTDLAKQLDRTVMGQYPIIPLQSLGKDFLAHHPSLKRPTTTPLYGMVVETFWKEE